MRALQNTLRGVVRRGLLGRGLFLVSLLTVLGTAPVAMGQDLLPADNGITEYHKSPRWRETESHPLRVVAYVLHPIGWGFRELVFRPMSFFIGSSSFSRSFWGFREPFDWRSGFCDKGGDAVPDCRTMSPWNTIHQVTPVGAEVVEGGLPGVDDEHVISSRQVCIPDVAFDFAKSTLNPLGRGRVRQVAQLLSSEPSLQVVVEGNADYVGSDEYNQKLGDRRSVSVIKELESLGVDPVRLVAASRGESAPVFTEEEDWARAVNRRVRFEIRPEQG